MTSNDIASARVSHRIQPLQVRLMPMWWYSSADDPARTSPLLLEDGPFENQMKRLTKVHDNLREEGPVPPLGLARASPVVSSDCKSTLQNPTKVFLT